jgi:hypothetical protein
MKAAHAPELLLAPASIEPPYFLSSDFSPRSATLPMAPVIEADAGTTNRGNARMELNAVFGGERTGAALRIAAS